MTTPPPDRPPAATPEPTLFRQVLAYHRAAAPEVIGTTPASPGPHGEAHYAFGFVEEEFRELRQAWASRDVPGVADALADLMVVCCRMAVIWGIDLDAVLAEVMRANLDKIRGGVRKNTENKVLKPEGWVPPDIEGVLARQAPLG